MPNIGPTELIIVLVIVLLIFGPKRLPGLGKQLGTGMREFKDSISGKSNKNDDDDDEQEERPSSRGRATEAALERPEGEQAPSRPRETEASLGSPEGEQAPLEGEVVRERSSR